MSKTMLSEKFVIAIFIALNLWIYNVYAQADCRPTGSDISIVELELVPGEILASPREILMDRTTEYISHTEDHSGVKYFQFSYDTETSRLLIMTESSFANYEKEQNSVSLLATVRIRCTNENMIDLYVTFNFEDVNHFAPEFSEDRYEIEIPLPLPTDINIFAIISERISATDYDLQNNQITFTSDITNQPFAVSTSGTTATMGKEFFANILTTEKILNIRNGVEFKITATDSGTALQQSSTVDVKLIAESDDEFIEVPIFTKSLYIGTLDFTQTPTLEIEIISLLADTFVDTISFGTDLSDGDYFQLNRNGLDNAIQIRLKDTVSQDNLNGITQLTFVITAARADGITGTAAVLVNVIPKKSLLFENTVYTGTIKSDMVIVHDLIKLIDSSHQTDVEFIIKDDPLGWFTIVSTPTVNEMKVELTSNLVDLEDKAIVSLTISAISTEGTALDAEAHVSLGIERAEVITPTFEKSFYEGVISNLEITDLEVLKLKTGTNIGNIIYEVIEHNDLFEAVDIGGDVQIIKIKLDETDITGVNTLQFTLTATNEEGIVGSTVVILSIDREEFVMPVFEKKLYTGNLKRPYSPTTFELDDILINPHEGVIEFDLNGDDIHLIKIETKLTNGVKLGLIDGVTIDAGKTVLTVIVTAKLTDSVIGSTVVLIHVEMASTLVIQPEFLKHFYYGSLSESYDLSMIDSTVKLTDITYSDTITFDKIGDDAKYFTISQMPNDNNVEIDIDTTANLDELADRTTLTFSIQATINDEYPLIGTTTVVIELPTKVLPSEVITPTFEKSFYEGVISNLEITDLEVLKLKTGTNIGNIIYEVIEHNDLFEAVDIGGDVQIIKIKLDETDITGVNTLQFTLTATNEEGIVGSTVVILSIDREEFVMPVFEKKLYTGNLKRPYSPTTFELDDILINPHEGVIEFDLNGDDIHLIKIETKLTNGVKLGLIDGVTIDAGKTVLTVIVTAKLTDSVIGSTVVLIHVEMASTPVIQPEFLKHFYYGSLSESYDLSMIDSTVKLTDITYSDTITFDKIGDDAKYFTISQMPNDNNVEIDIDTTANLDELADRTTLTFSIQATLNDEYPLIGTTTVVIELPTKVLPQEIIPTFEKPLYAGSLTTELKLSLEPLKIEIDTFSPGMQYELVDFDANLFDFTISTTETGTIDISTDKITEEILKSYQLFKFNVRAENDDNVVGITSVVIEIPPELTSDVIIPQFEHPIYNGVLQRNGLLKLDQIIKITEATYSSNLDFSIQDDSNLFEVINLQDSNIVEISMKPYDESDLQGKNVIHFAVIGTLTDDIIVTTSVLIDITPMITLTEPKFNEALYIGTLNADMAFSIGYPEITLDSFSDDIKYEKSGEDSDLFNLIPALQRVIIEPVVPITEENIRYKTNLRFTLTAIKSNGLSGSTAIVVEIPKIVVSEVLPQFERSFYKGSLRTDFSLDLSTINLLQSTYTEDVQFLVEDSMFEIDVTNSLGHVVTIKKSSAFNEAWFKDQKFYSFAVIARLGSLIEGTTTIILDIETPNDIFVPQFEQSLYEGVLSASYIPSVSQTIKLTDVSFAPDVVFTLDSGLDSDLFKLEHTSGENLVTIVSNGLNDVTTNMRTTLKFVITATKSSNLIGSTAIVITNPNAVLENIIVPKFDQLIYTGSISPELNFKMNDIIRIIEATQSPSLTYEIEGGNGLFAVTAINGNIITIGLNRNIEQSDINDKKVFSVTLVARLPDLVQGTATIIFDITSPNAILPPEFEKPLYVGKLSDTFRLEIVDLKLTEDSYSTDVVFDKVDEFDSNLFSITRNNNNIVITTNGITDDDILLKPVLQFAIRATKSNGLFGTTVIIIQIPSNTVDDFIIPIFEKPIYTGELSTDFDLDFTELIHVTGFTYSSAIQFTLEEGNSDFFEKINESGNEFGIQLSRPITASEIGNQKVLSFLIVARLGTFIHGTSTVIIDIDTGIESPVVFPVFEQSLYIGTLDGAFALQIVDIKLTDASYSTDVDFEVVDEFDSDYFEIDLLNTIGNNVKIVSTGLDEDILRGRTVFKFVISASKPNGYIGTTVVMITIPSVTVVIPEFDESIYHGFLSDTFELVNAIEVQVFDDYITSDISFGVKGEDSHLFLVTEVIGTRAKIELRDPLDGSEIQGRNEISFLVVAMKDGYWGSAGVVIHISDPSAALPPVFVQTLYIGSLNNDLELNPISIMLTDESYSNDVDFDLVPEYDYNFFEIESAIGNNVKLNVKSIDDDVINSNAALKVLIKATNTYTNLVGTTVVIVELQGTPSTTIIIPQFEQPLYVILLTTDLKIDVMEPIKIDSTTYSSDIGVELDGIDKNLFQYVKNGNEIMIETIKDLTENELEDKQMLSIILSAKLPTGEGSSTVVLFEIPFESCQIPNEDTIPAFDLSYYSSTIEPGFTGYILTVNAKVPTDETIKVIYGITVEDSGLASKIEIIRDTGELRLTDRVAPSVYNFVVTATNEVHNTVGYADIKLTVTSVVICTDGPTVSHSLIVKYLEEETPHEEFFDTTIPNTDCQYNIVTVTPNSLKSLFEIQGNLLTSKEFDRESDVFSNMVIPQISLLLQMVCNSDTQSLNGKYMSMVYNRTRAVRSTKDDLDDSYYVYTSSIERDAEKTILSIVIKDINDNSPVFQNPTEDILLGYPESKLAEKLLPPYLIKVFATDKDEGTNAKIRYTIDSNPHFGIHAETGVVHPLRNSMDDALQYDLVVKAIDQDGTGRATPLNIKVKRLEEKNFIIISIENEILDNLETILQKIETEVGIRVNVLNAVIVSSTMEDTETGSRSKRSATPFIDNEQTVLRIIGYAFNVDGDPIENEELESKIGEITTVSLISTQNLVEIIGDCDDEEDPDTCKPTVCENETECEESDNIGFIVGLIILLLLLLIACIVIFFMWWKFIRPYRYVKRDSTNEQLDRGFNDTGYTEPVVAPTAPNTDSDIFGKSNLEIKNENRPTAATAHSSPTSLAKSLQSVLDMDGRKPSIVLDKDNLSGSSETDDSSPPPSRERKKSIKFNETVERIDILDNAAEKERTPF